MNGSLYSVRGNYIGSNGRSSLAFPPGEVPGVPWADGITAISCDRASIEDNTIVDNTDIDLPVGGGNCSVIGNRIWHGGKYSLAGLNVGNFETNGNHAGSAFSGNSITSAVPNRLRLGILVGSHPWDDRIPVDDAGIVGPSDRGGANTIRGAGVNVLIEGATAGTVLSNDAANPSGTIPCLTPMNKGVNTDVGHSMPIVKTDGTRNYDEDFEFLRFDGRPNEPTVLSCEHSDIYAGGRRP